MNWRKWVVRGLVLTILGSGALVGIAYRFLTNPEAIRRKVLASLNASLPGAQIEIESAKMRLFGGIEVKELRMARRDDLDKNDFLYIPAATIFHDKEQLLDGKLAIRKVEVNRPRLRLVREHDGRWNLAGLTGPTRTQPQEPLPTIVIQQGTVVVEDRRAAAGTPPLEIRNVALTIVNDPLPEISFEGSGVCDVAGLVEIRGRITRGGGPMTCSIAAPALAVGPELIERIAGYCPDAAAQMRQLRAVASIKAELTWDSSLTAGVSHTISCNISMGEFQHPRIPWALQNMRVSFTCVNGVMPHAELHATSGGLQAHLTLRDLDLRRTPVEWTELVSELDLKLQDITVDSELFRKLPPEMQTFETDYAPAGTVHASMAFRRTSPTSWRKHWVLRADDAQAASRVFPCPVTKLRGTVEIVTVKSPSAASNTMPENAIAIDLAGEMCGRTMTVKGTIEGEPRTSGIQVDVRGNDLPIDDRILGRLPENVRKIVSSFNPSGLFDCRISLRRTRGQTAMTARHLVHVHDATTRYEIFPLPLSRVSCTIDVQPDRWEFRDFEGHHDGGVIRASGSSTPVSGTPTPQVTRQTVPPRNADAIQLVSLEKAAAPKNRVSVVVQCEKLPIDDAFRQALQPGREAVVRVLDSFALSGRFSGTLQFADVSNDPQDLDLSLSVAGCQMKPVFFAYPMEDVAAALRYTRAGLWVTQFQGRHGQSVIRIPQTTVHLKPAGGYWARLDGIHCDSLALDADLQRALPAALGKLLTTLQLRDQPIGLDMALVIDQGQSGNRPVVYWDSAVHLRNASMNTGVPWTKINGTITSRGLHNGEQLEDVVGRAYLESSQVLDQPLQRLVVPMQILKDSPDILRLPDIQAQFFGGSLGGEGRIEFGSTLRYELVLNALQVQLEQFGKHNFAQRADLSGRASASLHIKGNGAALDGLEGNGRIDVPSGKMYRLPLLLDLLKWLGLRLPDRTAFEQAHAVFRIEGPRLKITELDLYGNAISIRGNGAMDLDGSNLAVDLHADWARIALLLPPGINQLSRELSNQLLRIKVRGSVSDAKFEKELVPAVTDPLKKVWTGLGGGPKKAPAPSGP